MSIAMDAEKRREQILDAAERLFCEKGFDGTSTNDILAQTGIARGTLYYHFKSKEELLDGVIGRMAAQMTQRAALVIADQGMPFFLRLPAALLALRMKGELGQEVMSQMHKPQNALMHQKAQRELLTGVVPVLSAWAEEGVRLGLLCTEHTAVAVEMLVLYASSVLDDMPEADRAAGHERIEGFVYHAERLLGAPAGALSQALGEALKVDEGAVGDA